MSNYKETDIAHETDKAVVIKSKGAYTVYRKKGTHIESDCGFPSNPDGLSCAIARANYLTTRAARAL